MSLVALLLLSSSASAGPPFISDDPEPTDYQHWELYIFSQGTHAMGETSGVTPPSCDCNYGIVPNVQLHIQPGMAFAKANGTPLHLGPGDTEFGVKYCFIEQDKTSWIPSLAVYPLLEAPTGDAARGLGTGRTHAFVPLWIQKDFGDWTTFGGGGYWINPGSVGWVLERKITDKLTLGVRIVPPDTRRDRRHALDGFQHRRGLRFHRSLPFPVLVRKRPSARKGEERILLVHRLRTDRRAIAVQDRESPHKAFLASCLQD